MEAARNYSQPQAGNVSLRLGKGKLITPSREIRLALLSDLRADGIKSETP